VAGKRKNTDNKFRGKHVLVVEDSPLVGELLTILLRRYDHPSHARSAKEALREIEYEPPHIILIDLTLPDMDGLELVRTLRQDPKTKFIPILAMSSRPIAKTIWLEAGCNDFITKPFRPRDLFSRISGLLRRL
jgi:DNA-binding response OmpR family regulator